MHLSKYNYDCLIHNSKLNHNYLCYSMDIERNNARKYKTIEISLALTGQFSK